MSRRRAVTGPPRLRATILVAVAAGLLLRPSLAAAESLPEPPAHYFNDYAGFVSQEAAQRLDQKLEDFDKQTSTQIVVAIFPELPSASLEDFTIRTAQAWRVGRAKLDNGAILFVFVKDRQLRWEVGYGLEGALPDATAKRIIEDVIVPAFHEGHPDTGLEAGIDAAMAATRGEYRPIQPAKRRSEGSSAVVFFVFLALFIVLSRLQNRSRWASYDSRGRRGGPGGRGGWPGGWGGGWGGGGWGGGGWGGGGGSGGGFSGGGGSFGGGGASGRW